MFLPVFVHPRKREPSPIKKNPKNRRQKGGIHTLAHSHTLFISLFLSPLPSPMNQSHPNATLILYIPSQQCSSSDSPHAHPVYKYTYTYFFLTFFNSLHISFSFSYTTLSPSQQYNPLVSPPNTSISLHVYLKKKKILKIKFFFMYSHCEFLCMYEYNCKCLYMSALVYIYKYTYTYIYQLCICEFLGGMWIFVFHLCNLLRSPIISHTFTIRERIHQVCKQYTFFIVLSDFLYKRIFSVNFYLQVYIVTQFDTLMY